MDGYTIEHVRDMARDFGYESTSEARLLDAYPCINGVELDWFVRKFAGDNSRLRNKAAPTAWPCILHEILQFLFPAKVR